MRLVLKIFTALSLLLLTVFFSIGVHADTWVNGYMKYDGTYVKGHYRSDPDSTINNNWDTRGNVNPHTGRVGIRDPNSYGDNSGMRNRSWQRLKNRPGNRNRPP